MRYEVNAVMYILSLFTADDLLCLQLFLFMLAPTLTDTVTGACRIVGGSSQANHLMRNSAMDDSIGGS